MISTDSLQSTWLHDPDVQLMLRTRDGDDAAFTELVTAWQDRLIGVFFHMLQDRTIAEDLAQDVFLRVYRARDRYVPTAKFSTWLFRIAQNVARNRRRHLARNREVQANLRDSGPLGALPNGQLATEKSAVMPTRQLDKSELQTVVREALNLLNERQRMAVLLNKFEGMGYAEIADVMGLKPEAVKSLLSRARENLRVSLERYVS